MAGAASAATGCLASLLALSLASATGLASACLASACLASLSAFSCCLAATLSALATDEFDDGIEVLDRSAGTMFCTSAARISVDLLGSLIFIRRVRRQPLVSGL
ncbi:hypothetical protein D3C87_1390740 [compost metagenome]